MKTQPTPETIDAWNAVSRMPNGMYDSSVPMEKYASAMLDHSKKLERERDEAREQLVGIEDKMRLELGGHPNSKLWGDAGLIAATMRCVDALGEVTDQRDDARAEMIRWMSIAEGRGHTYSLASSEQLHRAEMEYDAAVNAYHEAEQECRSSFYEHNQASYRKGRRDALRMFLPNSQDQVRLSRLLHQTISNQ